MVEELLFEHVTELLSCDASSSARSSRGKRCDSNTVAVGHGGGHGGVAALLVLFRVLLLSLVLAVDDNDDRRPTLVRIPPPALVSLSGDALHEQLSQPGPISAATCW